MTSQGLWNNGMYFWEPVEASELWHDTMIDVFRLKIVQHIKDLEFSIRACFPKGELWALILLKVHAFCHNSGDFFELWRIQLLLLAHLKTHCAWQTMKILSSL